MNGLPVRQRKPDGLIFINGQWWMVCLASHTMPSLSVFLVVTIAVAKKTDSEIHHWNGRGLNYQTKQTNQVSTPSNQDKSISYVISESYDRCLSCLHVMCALSVSVSSVPGSGMVGRHKNHYLRARLSPVQYQTLRRKKRRSFCSRLAFLSFFQWIDSR